MPARNNTATLPGTAGGGSRLRWPFRRLLLKGAGDGQAESGLKRAHFKEWRLPFWLLAPQLFILLLFFFIPSIRALIQAFQLTDPFGATTQWVGFQNFERLFRSGVYWSSAQVTLIFTLAQNVLTLSVALLLAFASNHILRGRGAYRTVLLLPYAIAPAIAGIMLAFLFNPRVGPVAQMLQGLGLDWDPNRNSWHALALVVMAASWKHICYNYIFLVAALMSVPQSILESAYLDGAGPVQRFLRISLPMITPTLFFLIVINFVYGLFETFAIIDATTRGGPAGATSILVYKVYQDGFVTLDLGSSAAQSVVLMALALFLTFAQFRFVERRVNYSV
ncbi:glycerol-3-phosphate transporter permease [Bosea sp. Root670]|uniref:sn-glycerol-3-phosphate transport system permease protein UgpA n=1 Tax=Bosea robiniae TaxID=1036780 RepID=A0ABY0NUE8_9HYPH|nr:MULTISPECIES: ABC transporter permease subunit [Bosea]KRE01259.1 glycerol-3-phosphate transporter permease [Bosea sp. Root670]SDG16001.1 sn-glycerol 3-phosphate transport system permease protein [Bosea robiniae]